MGSTTDLQYIDEESVQDLQLRAPAVSGIDRQDVTDLMRKGLLFKAVRCGKKRKQIENNLLGLSYLIPSIFSIQQDGKYIRRCGAIIRKLLHGDGRSMSRSIRKLACSHYHSRTKSRSTIDCPIFMNRLKLLYVDIMGDIVALTGERCMLESNEKPGEPLQYDGGAWSKLARRAQQLGFSSEYIRELIATDPARELVRRTCLQARKPQDYIYDESDIEQYIQYSLRFFDCARPIKKMSPVNTPLTGEDGAVMKRRCGRQYSAAYYHDRSYYTVDTLNCVTAPGPDITSLFVWKSQFHCFWGHEMVQMYPDCDTKEVDTPTAMLQDDPIEVDTPTAAFQDDPIEVDTPTAEFQNGPGEVGAPTAAFQEKCDSGEVAVEQYPGRERYPDEMQYSMEHTEQISQRSEFSTLSKDNISSFNELDVMVRLSDAPSQQIGQTADYYTANYENNNDDNGTLDHTQIISHSNSGDTCYPQISRNIDDAQASRGESSGINALVATSSTPKTFAAVNNNPLTTAIWVFKERWVCAGEFEKNDTVNAVQHLMGGGDQYLYDENERGIVMEESPYLGQVFMTSSSNGFEGNYPYEL
ncbi:hypothetical protein LEL_10879 [Akanthomyces lecanii RCEF 1005]|uniref:Uncharacterized protein n=1 Tax=Akanthomyces lecanii RCEF 1005 TaxID=1081108 RepID=A0A167RJG2_CORDF|nr:hypothetical protein LEL_10879 [Akanthomyces lecanii RCEF 1005]